MPVYQCMAKQQGMSEDGEYSQGPLAISYKYEENTKPGYVLGCDSISEAEHP